MEIPGYKILETLGKGGMATVYLAIQESFERKVAIKVMSPQLAQDPSFGERFQREAKIVSQMNHPNIVTVYDVGVVNNHHYLAMEYVSGKELRDKFPSMDLTDRIKAIREVASALNYAGNKGYVHRDVKPENVMMCDENDRAVLMDFGIAKTTDADHSMTKTGMAIGTPYYMSPEQAQGKAVDKRTDIYSLGVMFYQMLTGRVPYDADSQVAIGIKHITEPVPFLPNHLRVFQPIINKVMAKDPNQRYQTGAEFIKDLDKVSVADIEEVGRIIQQDVEAATRTDPHAATVVANAAAAIMNTGNVTTADAARRANRIGAEQQAPPPTKNKQSPIVAIAVIAVLLVGGGWFLTRMNTADTATDTVSAVTSAEMAVTESATPSELAPAAPAATADPLPKVVTPAPAPEPVKQEATGNTSAALVAEAEAKKSQEAAKAMEQQKAAEQQKKQQELAKAEKAKQQELQAQQKQAATKAQQAQLLAIEVRLNKAEVLREQGHLVAPEGNNAVAAYRAVLELDAGNAEAIRALKEIENSYLMAIRYQIDQGKLDEAESKLREAAKIFPGSAALADLQALQQKKESEAATAKAEVARPKISKIVVSDMTFDNMDTAQKAELPMGRTAYVGFNYQSFQTPATVLQAVLYDSARTVKIIQKPVVISGAEGKMFFTLGRPVEGFADGGYNLDLLLGDQKLATAEFLVKH